MSETRSHTLSGGLPRLAPPTSSIMTFVVPPPDRSHNKPQRHQSNIDRIPIPSVYSIYPPFDHSMTIPPRLNPLVPPPPERRTISLETDDVNAHNQSRRDLMAKRDYHRYHTNWSRYYYGNTTEKELYQKYLRQSLKEQMEDSKKKDKEDFLSRSKESRVALQRDREDIESDVVSGRKRMQDMTTFRDANKELMDQVAQRKRLQKFQENQVDREVLKYNPINWSCSLK
jgi:hypothetical protein